MLKPQVWGGRHCKTIGKKSGCVGQAFEAAMQLPFTHNVTCNNTGIFKAGNDSSGDHGAQAHERDHVRQLPLWVLIRPCQCRRQAKKTQLSIPEVMLPSGYEHVLLMRPV